MVKEINKLWLWLLIVWVLAASGICLNAWDIRQIQRQSTQAACPCGDACKCENCCCRGK